MGHIIDRRKNWKGKSTGNRRKFIKRVEGQIKKALPNIVADGDIKDMATGNGKIKVPIKGIKEPKFRYDGDTGKKEYVVPGNDRFYGGDHVPRPKKGGGGQGGRKGSKDGEGEDEFIVEINREEFLKYFFEDLELPDLIKQDIADINVTRYKRAGYTKDSTPSRLNVVSSVKNSLARKIGIGAIFESKIKKLEEELKTTKSKKRIEEIEQEIKKLKAQKIAVPFLDNIDLRYNNFENVEEPTTKAVMFCVMDVSASMGQREKAMSKKFFTLLYMFLHKKYENIKLIFIRHHILPKEVGEDEFFNSRDTGGTVVAPALEMVNDIIDERFGDEWNIYVAQCSDGDVWGMQDARDCVDILSNKVLDKIQYFAYIEICRFSNENSELWQFYQQLSLDYRHFAMQQVFDESEIWKVFKQLFKPKKVYTK